jgi:thymidylate synthase (FAD)
MIVRAVAATQFLLSDAEDQWAIEQTGYKMHPFKLDLALNPGHPEAEVRTTDNCVTHIDELHEAAGRQCYESFARPNPKTASNSGYLDNIAGQQHFSVMEHGCITMWCDGWSRNMLLELERHQHHEFLALSVLSSRYVPMEGKPLVYPPILDLLSVPKAEALKKEFDTAHMNSVETYEHVYEELMKEGFTKKECREAAREILPGGIATTFYATSNVRSWRNIISKRDFDGAAKEIQLFAQAVKAELVKVAPNSMRDMV